MNINKFINSHYPDFIFVYSISKYLILSLIKNNILLYLYLKLVIMCYANFKSKYYIVEFCQYKKLTTFK